MEPHTALPLLAGLTPAQFMRRHWQKKPLLVRAAIADFKPLLSRSELFKLARTEGVESRLIEKTEQNWHMKNGPFAARGVPPVSKPGWTLLVQGVDGHAAAMHQLLQQFRFVPDARLDDVMVSFATPGGGVGAHFDSYDVFLLQASGSRRWKISKQKDLTLQPDKPLKILQNFLPDEEFVLHAGDMLYLPPRYAHDGVAEPAVDANGKAVDCMTYSIGFKSPETHELAAELLHRLAEFNEDDLEADAAGKTQNRYRDPHQTATSNPALLPDALAEFARDAVSRVLKDPLAIACALGEIMTTPKPGVWFEDASSCAPVTRRSDIKLVAKTRMMYDAHHVFINGESYRAKGSDAVLMQRLADQRCLMPAELLQASSGALALLSDWCAAGWIFQLEG
jgi:50S ribosomal protein L16 3-hydroxylase